MAWTRDHEIRWVVAHLQRFGMRRDIALDAVLKLSPLERKQMRSTLFKQAIKKHYCAVCTDRAIVRRKPSSLSVDAWSQP